MPLIRVEMDSQKTQWKKIQSIEFVKTIPELLLIILPLTVPRCAWLSSTGASATTALSDRFGVADMQAYHKWIEGLIVFTCMSSRFFFLVDSIKNVAHYLIKEAIKQKHCSLEEKRSKKGKKHYSLEEKKNAAHLIKKGDNNKTTQWITFSIYWK